MATTYYLKFGSGDPAPFTGLSPTLTVFAARGLTALQAPTILESALDPGIYVFSYTPTLSILFKADGGAALASGDRYISNALDPAQAIGSAVGFTTDSIGSTATDPSTVLGYLRRAQEFMEGNATFNKSSGIWDVYSRGSSTLLVEKTLTNTTTAANKS